MLKNKVERFFSDIQRLNDTRLSALMDSDLAWVNGKSGR